MYCFTTGLQIKTTLKIKIRAAEKGVPGNNAERLTSKMKHETRNMQIIETKYITKINKREEKEGVLFLSINTIKSPYKTFSNQKSFVSLVVRHIMFNLHSGVGNSVLCQKKGVGQVIFIPQNSKYSSMPPCTICPYAGEILTLYIPKARKRYPFRAEPPYGEYSQDRAHSPQNFLSKKSQKESA